MKSSDAKSKFVTRQRQFQKSRNPEKDYAKKLKSIAKQIGILVNGFAPEGQVSNLDMLVKALTDYADMITPWARTVAARMLYDIAKLDEGMWFKLGEEIGRDLRKEIEFTRTGTMMTEALNEQVNLIRSLPIEAAQRVHQLTMEAISDGTRAKEIAAEILRTGHVTASRATLIARTEVGRTAAELTKARAATAGSEYFIWRTAGDQDVRHDHAILNGKMFKWTDPPVSDIKYNRKSLPGAIYNCRCYPEPVIPETY